MKDVILDRAATSAPAVGYLSIWLAGVSIQDIVAVMTGVLVALQIVRAGWDLWDRRRKGGKDVVTKSAD